MSNRHVSYILAAISLVGALAISFDDPQFLDRAIVLEISFIALAILTFKGFRKSLYVCIPIAVAVMIGNSLAPPHVEIMTTFSKPFNAVLLIVGGCVLQIALIGASIFELAQSRKRSITEKTS